jgi:hypothetical protein
LKLAGASEAENAIPHQGLPRPYHLFPPVCGLSGHPPKNRLSGLFFDIKPGQRVKMRRMGRRLDRFVLGQ